MASLTSSPPQSPRGRSSSMRKKMKYIVVTGGVVSGLGKGITISSVGVIMKRCGFRVTSIKIDPYLNTDAGTMSPFEHGEVYVLKDGGEVDLDLGNYERFLGIELTRDHNITTGKAYHQVIQRERRGDYLGKTVQVVPHVTNAIQDWIERVAYESVDGKVGPADICLIEVGGTVGDIESMIFLEALRQFQFRVGRENCCFLHVSLVPVLGSVGEQKTKPTQHSVRELRSVGLTPDVIVCRSGQKLKRSTQDKISLFCHVPPANVLSVHDVTNIYHVALILCDQGLPNIIANKLQVEPAVMPPDMASWADMADMVDNLSIEVHVALVGKYTDLQDSYLSVLKALKHGAFACRRKLIIDWVEASDLEMDESSEDFIKAWELITNADGVLVPGGFGDRGIKGKLKAISYARTSKTPYLGICLGMQLAVVEFAQNVLGIDNATSTEFDEKAENPLIIFMPEINPSHMGGTMRLGSRQTLFHQYNEEVSIAETVYGNNIGVFERHRHRYEVNPEYVTQLEDGGLRFTGVDDKGQRMEIIELPESVHPFFFATQFHPEFKTRPQSPSPPFAAFIQAAAKLWSGAGKGFKKIPRESPRTVVDDS
jgi:CTP synthase